MKPMGTITKYYNFIDEEIQEILNTVFEETSSYFDFVQRLTSVILKVDAPTDLVYIATTQTWLVKDQELLNATTKKYGDLPCIKAWKTSSKNLQFVVREEYQKIKDVLDEALQSSIADWMVVEQLLNHTVNISMPLESIRYLTIAKEMLDQNSNLQCFEPLIHVSEGRFAWHEGNLSRALTNIQRGLAIARDYADIVYEYFGLLMLANIKKQQKYQEGLDVFEEAYQIAQILEVPYFVAEIMNDSSMAYEIGGEYDLAISSQIEGIDSFDGDIGIEICYGILSRLYAALGDGHQSLEWANRQLNRSSYHVAYLRKTRALIILDRLDEAEKNLEIAYQKVLETGYDLPLSRYHLISGLLEMARGELLTAQGSLEQAYDIVSKVRGSITLNEILIALAQVELALLKESESNDAVRPGKWLSTLENHAYNHDLPGVAMQAGLLRSARFQSQGQLKDAHETLQQALKISDSPGVMTLRKRITARIQEIDSFMKEEEKVS